MTCSLTLTRVGALLVTVLALASPDPVRAKPTAAVDKPSDGGGEKPGKDSESSGAGTAAAAKDKAPAETKEVSPAAAGSRNPEGMLLAHTALQRMSNDLALRLRRQQVSVSQPIRLLVLDRPMTAATRAAALRVRLDELVSRAATLDRSCTSLRPSGTTASVKSSIESVSATVGSVKGLIDGVLAVVQLFQTEVTRTDADLELDKMAVLGAVGGSLGRAGYTVALPQLSPHGDSELLGGLAAVVGATQRTQSCLQEISSRQAQLENAIRRPDPLAQGEQLELLKSDLALTKATLAERKQLEVELAEVLKSVGEVLDVVDSNPELGQSLELIGGEGRLLVVHPVWAGTSIQTRDSAWMAKRSYHSASVILAVAFFDDGGLPLLTTNLAAREGWTRQVDRRRYSAGGHEEAFHAAATLDLRTDVTVPEVASQPATKPWRRIGDGARR